MQKTDKGRLPAGTYYIATKDIHRMSANPAQTSKPKRLKHC